MSIIKFILMLLWCYLNHQVIVFCNPLDSELSVVFKTDVLPKRSSLNTASNKVFGSGQILVELPLVSFASPNNTLPFASIILLLLPRIMDDEKLLISLDKPIILTPLEDGCIGFTAKRYLC